jgi:hypothetical protein
MNKSLKKIRDIAVITLVLVMGGGALVVVGTYGDYARHDRIAHHQQ